MAVHRHARSFDEVAEAYERGRPTFPAVIVDHLVTALDLRPGRRVVDVAAGTGKLTRDLLASGAEVLAVEPMAGMRQVFAREVPGVPVLDGTAEMLPLPDDHVDAVTVAQAFHWFDPQAAFEEMDRVLRPGGRVALVWNLRDEDDALEAAATAIIDRHRDGTPGHRGLDLEGSLAASPFVEVDLLEHAWVHDVDEETFVDRFLSVSFVASLDPGRSSEVEAALRALFTEHAVDGTVRHAYTCHSHILEQRG